MPTGPAPNRLRISRGTRRTLKLLVRRQRAPFALVQRARILLLTHQGVGTEQIARQLGCSSRNVRKWKARFHEDPRAESLEDRVRSGRPAQVPVEIRCKLVQLACERPDGNESPAPFRDIWTCGSLADALEIQTGYRISVSEVGRILRFESLRPHRMRQWLKSSDPEFLPKAKRICNLYLRPTKNAVVVCVDEKPMQVLARRHPTHVDHRDASIRYEYEYKRHGTQALLAALRKEGRKQQRHKTSSVAGKAARPRPACSRCPTPMHRRAGVVNAQRAPLGGESHGRRGAAATPGHLTSRRHPSQYEAVVQPDANASWSTCIRFPVKLLLTRSELPIGSTSPLEQ